jgi:metal-dependent amidase/aminoacylase/carboxypeptidase family protein
LATELGITVQVFGTPAEENGGGKILMLDAGLFAGTHLAMMVHPSNVDRVHAHVLAGGDLRIDFSGKNAHARGSTRASRSPSRRWRSACCGNSCVPVTRSTGS